MPVPTYDQFIEPLLRILAAYPDGLPAPAAHEAAAQALGLTEEQRAERLPSGTQPVYKNRSGWAHDRLKRAGYSSAPKRGLWRLTQAGREFAAHNPALSSEQVEQIALHNGRVAEVRVASGPDIFVPSTESPDERLEAAIEELSSAVSEELLEALHQCSPAFFEVIVLDVLHAIGYGTSRKDLERVGRSNDGGIDGIISLDRLGLEKVYVQAKRWKSTVGRPDVQGFYGALAGQRARKGVFITTSAYSPQAIDFAASVEGVILIDGRRLAQLMIEYGVGISHRTIRVPKLDGDYFEE